MSPAVSQSSLLHVHYPAVSCGLLTAALGRRLFTAELKLQENTAGRGIRSAAPTPGGPTLHHVCNPSGHGATAEVTGDSISSSGLGMAASVGWGGMGVQESHHAALGKPPGQSWAAGRHLGDRSQCRKDFKKYFWGHLAGSVRGARDF